MKGNGNLSLELHSADLANFGRSQTISLVSRPKFAKNHESQTKNPSVVLNAESTESSLRGQIADSPKAIQKNKIKSARSANPRKSFCYFLLLQKVESPLPYQPKSTSDFTITQNLVKNKSARSANPRKIFCYFWLSPKVESSLPYQLQTTSDSTIP